MIKTASLMIGLLWVLFAAIHFLLAIFFRFWHLRQLAATQIGRVDAVPSGDAIPASLASVLVATRGSDPSFQSMLQALVGQVPPPLEVIVIADGLGAWQKEWLPDWSIANGEPASRLPGQNPLRVLRCDRSATVVKLVDQFERLPHCGMKCSALIAGLQVLSPESQVCVFADADVIPAGGWLGMLTQAVDAKECGVASGVVWFEPPDCRLGSLVRSLFNSAAMFPTALFANPWAGSMALRREVVEQSGLREKWALSVVDDGPLREHVERLGMRTVFVPQLILANSESCHLRFAGNWLGRTMKWSWLYDPTCWRTMVHAVFSAALLLGGIGVLAGALCCGDWAAAGILACLVSISCGLFEAGWWTMRGAWIAALQTSYRRSGVAIPFARGLAFTLLGLFIVPLTLGMFAAAALSAPFRKDFLWRGILYRVERGDRVQWKFADSVSLPAHNSAKTPSRNAR